MGDRRPPLHLMDIPTQVMSRPTGPKLNSEGDVVFFPAQPSPDESPRVVSAADRETGVPGSPGAKDVNELALSASPAVLDHEWLLSRAGHPNVLVVGTDSVVNQALSTLRDECRQPVVTAVATNPLALPSGSACGTLILRNVLGLSLEGQRRLLAWLDDAHGRTQVIATAAQTPWPRIETGTFLGALYYRLNIVYVDLT